MNWRPKAWDNPHPILGSGLPTNDLCYSQYDLAREYEAGADAMLEVTGDLLRDIVLQYSVRSELIVAQILDELSRKFELWPDEE